MLWHMFRYHWVPRFLGPIWYQTYSLTKPGLAQIYVRNPRLYRKMDVILFPEGSVAGLRINDVTDAEWDLIIHAQTPAELSRVYMDITEVRETTKDVPHNGETAEESKS